MIIMTELIISEKPNAAKRIADALADGSAKKESDNGVPFYTLTHNGQEIIVGCAVGHLYGLKTKEKGFPIFNIEWVPSAELSKGSAFTKKYVATLKRLAKRCKTFTVATDFDIEGEVIGLNVVRHICKQKDAHRMKFSTLTKDELIEAYEKKEKHLDWGQANAGETRHKLDWYYGINISRALTRSISRAGMFKLLSTGRVQGPALRLLADREQSIKDFKPEPYWELELKGKLEKGEIVASHKSGKFTEEKKVLDILDKTKGEKAEISDIKSRSQKVQPPHPFDLTSLQIEAHGKVGLTPKKTLAFAQELYVAGFISYPRTSSQQYPESIKYKKILKDVARNPLFKESAEQVLAMKSIKPNNGKKTDAAHPAIYPTGIVPKTLDPKARKLYHLIVRRFLATFGEHAVRETVTYTIDCAEEQFITKGTVTKEKGWMELYGEFVKAKNEELPQTTKGEVVKNKKVKKLDKETQPPKRFTESSIIKELEKQGLGTKATRAAIVDTLFNRNYVEGKKLTVTDLGMQVVDILEKYCPKITDQEMTRNFEEDMEKIREDKIKPETVLSRAQKVITEIIEDFEKKEAKVGEGLKETFTETRDKLETLGKCPNCKEGLIRLRKGKYGAFAACSAYPDCKTTYGLPNNVMIKPVETENMCKTCKAPVALVIRAKTQPREKCINPKCPDKDEGKIEGEGKTCEKCKKGKMVVRKSLYGSFLGCNKYPKCKNLIQLKKKDHEEK